MLYTLFYIIMKLRYRERITWQPAIYTFVSLFTWAGAMYFFLNKSTSWVKTPAQSRRLNMDCRWDRFAIICALQCECPKNYSPGCVSLASGCSMTVGASLTQPTRSIPLVGQA